MQWAGVLRAARDECGSFFGTLYRLRAVLLFAPVLLIAFTNDQILDVAREYLYSERHFADRFDFVLLTLAVTAAVPILFVPFILEQPDSESGYGFGRRLAIGVVISVALLPAVYFLAELHSGPTGLVSNQYSAWNTSFTSMLALCSIISLVFALLPPVMFVPLAYLWRVLRLRWAYIGFVVLVLVGYLGLCLLPLLVSDERLFPLVGSMAQRLGVFPFIGLFSLALFSLAALSTRLFDTWRIPLLSLLVLAIVAFAAMGLNSDFNARLLGPGDREMQPRPIGEAFREWLAARQDYPQYRDAKPARPYPVYLVAMAGGGAYAGFHSAYFLERLFESCPKLRHHTFAISGVSGGALGAALIAAEAGESASVASSGTGDTPLACNVDPSLADDGPKSRRIERFFSRDHVSFLIWARLFPDMLRRLFWFNMPAMSSDTLFEEWFTANWANLADGHKALSLSDSVYSYWSPKGDAPAVFLNITNTQTGRTEVVSPLHFPRNLPSRKNPDMRLITAASLSFRIPFLNSPGTLPRNTSIPAQGFDPVTNYDTLETTATYVDGSYYETSGLHVLDRIRAAIKQGSADLNVDVRVISFSLAPNRETLRSSDSEQDTLLAPVNALFAARIQRGVDEWEKSLRKHGDLDAYLALYQDNFHHHLPLGWTLSPQSLSFIKHHYGVPSDCDYTERFWERMLDDFDGARVFFAKRFAPAEYGNGIPGIRPRDLDVKDSNRLSKLDMLSERIYMGCQVGKIFRNLAQ